MCESSQAAPNEEPTSVTVENWASYRFGGALKKTCFHDCDDAVMSVQFSVKCLRGQSGVQLAEYSVQTTALRPVSHMTLGQVTLHTASGSSSLNSEDTSDWVLLSLT